MGECVFTPALVLTSKSHQIIRFVGQFGVAEEEVHGLARAEAFCGAACENGGAVGGEDGCLAGFPAAFGFRVEDWGVVVQDCEFEIAPDAGVVEVVFFEGWVVGHCGGLGSCGLV